VKPCLKWKELQMAGNPIPMIHKTNTMQEKTDLTENLFNGTLQPH
jgi:hypothetical protein